VDAQRKALRARQLLGDETLGEIIEDAHNELTEYVIHGETPEIREDARCRILGIREVINRLEYEASLYEEPEEDADTLDTLES
jgi:hypothetical protein